VKKTNFLQGLYSDEELTPTYLKEGRDNKTLFMKKLVTAICKSKHYQTFQKKKIIYLDIAVKRPPDVRVSKILAGQEADKTNLLLQALAEAINLDVNNNEVVRKTLQTLGETNENEEAPRSRDRDHKDQERSSERHRSKEERSSKSHEPEEQTSEKRSSSRDASRVKKIKILILINKILLFEKEQGDTADGSSHSRRRRSSRVNDDNASEEKKPVAIQRQDDDDDDDKKVIRKFIIFFN
jgi:TRAF3-interacting protein 1